MLVALDEFVLNADKLIIDRFLLKLAKNYTWKKQDAIKLCSSQLDRQITMQIMLFNAEGQ